MFPRSQAAHERKAAEVLDRHALATGVAIRLPVPIEPIIEQTFELHIVYDTIPEPPGSTILGCLSPSERLITINTTHEALLESVMGPERFTLGHELAHWLYDADDPNQGSFDFDSSPAAPEFCYWREGELSEQLRIREVNANKLAAALLLPAGVMRDLDVEAILFDPRGFAADAGVSRKTLAIRLGDLGLVDSDRAQRLSLEWG